MDRQTLLILIALGLIGGCLTFAKKKRESLRKVRALRASFTPHFKQGSFLVKITYGPKWALGEYGTFDAGENKILIEGESFDASQFEFILA